MTLAQHSHKDISKCNQILHSNRHLHMLLPIPIIPPVRLPAPLILCHSLLLLSSSPFTPYSLSSTKLCQLLGESVFLRFSANVATFFLVPSPLST